MRSRGRISKQLFLLCLILSANSIFATTLQKVHPNLVGTWKIKFEVVPMYHYHIPIYITVSTDGSITDKSKSPFPPIGVISKAKADNKSIQFNWVYAIKYDSEKIEFEYTFQGKAIENKNNKDRQLLSGEILGRVNFIHPCDPRIKKESGLINTCPKTEIDVKGEWSAKHEI